MTTKREYKLSPKMDRSRNRGYFAFPPIKHQIRSLENSKEDPRIHPDTHFLQKVPDFSLYYPEGS